MPILYEAYFEFLRLLFDQQLTQQIMSCYIYACYHKNVYYFKAVIKLYDFIPINKVGPLSQIIWRFSIAFIMYLDMTYISRCVVKAMNLSQNIL